MRRAMVAYSALGLALMLCGLAALGACEKRDPNTPRPMPSTTIAPMSKAGPAQPGALTTGGSGSTREVAARPDPAPAPRDASPPSSTGARGIPREAHRYRAELIRNARVVWGLDAPVAAFAAQIHQESGWRANARSPVGAQGMTQFMPATAAWIAKAYPAELGDNQPLNPSWAIRALVTYDKYLWDRVAAADGCHRLCFALSAYNGGLGWVQRDKKLAQSKGLDPALWWDAVETVNAGRSAANHRENRGYPQRILRKLTPLYVSDGWGQGACL